MMIVQNRKTKSLGVHSWPVIISSYRTLLLLSYNSVFNTATAATYMGISSKARLHLAYKRREQKRRGTKREREREDWKKSSKSQKKN